MPTQISGCQLWLDGNDPLGTGVAPANGAGISKWVNKGLATTNLVLYTTNGGSNPTYAANFQNGLGSVAFNNNAFLSSFPFNLSTRTIFLVCVQNVAQFCGIMGLSAANNDSVSSTTGIAFQASEGAWYFSWLYNIFNGSNQIIYANSSPNTGYYLYTGTSAIATPLNIYEEVFSNNYEQTFVNGNAGQTFTTTTTPGNSTQIYVGCRWDATGSGQSLNGNILEVIIYNTALVPTQIKQVEGYLAQKWGRTSSLPAGHPGLTQTFYVKNPGIATTPSRAMTNLPYFIPTSISNCMLWFDAADASTVTFSSGSNISTWKDKSGKENTLSITGTPPPYPTYVLNTVNGMPAVDTSQDASHATPVYLSATIPSTTFPNFVNTYFEVMTMTTSPEWNIAVEYTHLTNNTHWFRPSFNTSNTNTVQYWNGATYTPGATISTGAIPNVQLTTSSNSGISSGISLNGATATTGSALVLNTNPTTFYITGRRCEIIMYNRILDASEQAQVQGYLAWKWGLTSSLPSTHPFKSVPPGRPSQVAGLPLLKQMTYYIAPGNLPYYQVRAVDWSSSWQPYLQGLATANSTATASLSTYSAGSAANYTASSYGALAPNGLMYFIGGTGVVVLNPTTNTATILGSVNTGSYSGLVLGTNGNLYGIPYGSGTVLVITPSATSPYGTVTTIGSGLDSYQGGCLGPNGTIYALPWTGSNILTITGNTVAQVAISPSCQTRGSVVGPDGNIYGCPWASSAILKINTSTNTSSTIACDGGRYWGCCLAPNGLIYFSHFDSGHFAILNVSTNAVTTAGSPPSAYNNCIVLGPNGKLYLSGGYTNILEYNYNTNTYVTIGSTPATSGSSINLAPNGNIYIPGTSATVGNYISFSGLSQLPTSNYCLSAYTNKF